MTWLARLPVLLRWIVLPAWIAVAVWSAVQLPTIERSRAESLGSLAPENAKAVQAEIESKTRFGLPLLSRTVLVEYDANGLTPLQQATVLNRARLLNAGDLRGFEAIGGALPVLNTFGPSGYVKQRGTTAVTYLFFKPDASLRQRTDVSRRLAERIRPQTNQGFVGVTGQAPALIEQGQVIVDRLHWVEIATLLLVALAMGWRFRSLGAPLVTLGTVGIAYLVSSRVVAIVGDQIDVRVPQEVEPVIVVLLFGIVTDYSIFYMSRFRGILAEGESRVQAAKRATGQITPLIVAAALCIIAGTVTLLTAELAFLRVFGPGMAFAVLTGAIVSITLIPACLGIFGSAIFWPRRPTREISRARAAEEPGSSSKAGRSWMVSFACSFPRVTTVFCVLVLGGLSLGLMGLQFSNPVIRGLPSDNPVREAYEAGTEGFAPGVLSPTVLIVNGRGIESERRKLADLQRELGRQPGVSLVLGPAQQPLGDAFGVTLSGSGDAARYFIVLDSNPLGAEAIGDVRSLQRRAEALARRAGLPDAQLAFAGDTALAAETIDTTNHDLRRILPLTLLAIFFVVALFLRALVAPLYLVAASVLSFTATLGLAAMVFGDLTYYVPFASAVLLIALGSDYNVFIIGRIWQESENRPLKEAVPVASKRAAKAITLAGLVLAGSFALVALVPIRPFHELAFIMAVGILIDAYFVRTLLIPALVTIVGRWSAWPGRHLAAENPASRGTRPAPQDDEPDASRATPA